MGVHARRDLADPLEGVDEAVLRRVRARHELEHHALARLVAAGLRHRHDPLAVRRRDHARRRDGAGLAQRLLPGELGRDGVVAVVPEAVHPQHRRPALRIVDAEGRVLGDVQQRHLGRRRTAVPRQRGAGESGEAGDDLVAAGEVVQRHRRTRYQATATVRPPLRSPRVGHLLERARRDDGRTRAARARVEPARHADRLQRTDQPAAGVEARAGRRHAGRHPHGGRSCAPPVHGEARDRRVAGGR